MFGAAVFAALAGIAVAAGSNGCLPPRTDECRVHSDCSKGGICSLRGYCVRECQSAHDCPCGALCAPGCGLCLRDDRGGAATCFAHREGLTTNDVLGVCRGDLAVNDARPDAAQGTDAGEGRGDAETDGGALSVASACRRAAPVCEETSDVDGSAEDAEAAASDAADTPDAPGAPDASGPVGDAGEEGGPGDGG